MIRTKWGKVEYEEFQSVLIFLGVMQVKCNDLDFKGQTHLLGERTEIMQGNLTE